MKKIYILLGLLLLCKSSQAQMGTMKWHFRSRNEVVTALQKTRNNLSASYDVLICAGRQGYTNTSIGFYETQIAGQELNASVQDSAAYAFAYDLGYSSRPWGWKRDLDRSMIKNSSASSAQHFRDRAYSLQPNNPQVLIMRAFYEQSLLAPERKNAYESALKAVNLAPQWADAYYWLGTVTSSYANSFSTRITREEVKPNTSEMENTRATITRLGRVMLRAFDTAEKLDPSLHQHLLWSRIYAYEKIRDKKSAQMIPLLVEQHLRAFPNFGSWYSRNTGRSVEDFRRSYKRLAEEINKQAKG